jgi:hypothetical protein
VPKASGGFLGLLDGLLGAASDYVTDGVSIGVKTNYGPEIPVATAALGSSSSTGEDSGAGGGFLAGLFGVKAAVVVRNQRGEIISTFGQVPKTEPLRAVVVVLLIAGVAYLAVRGAIK